MKRLQWLSAAHLFFQSSDPLLQWKRNVDEVEKWLAEAREKLQLDNNNLKDFDVLKKLPETADVRLFTSILFCWIVKSCLHGRYSRNYLHSRLVSCVEGLYLPVFRLSFGSLVMGYTYSALIKRLVHSEPGRAGDTDAVVAWQKAIAPTSLPITSCETQQNTTLCAQAINKCMTMRNFHWSLYTFSLIRI